MVGGGGYEVGARGWGRGGVRPFPRCSQTGESEGSDLSVHVRLLCMFHSCHFHPDRIVPVYNTAVEVSTCTQEEEATIRPPARRVMY